MLYRFFCILITQHLCYVQRMLPRFPPTALVERVVGGEGGCRRLFCMLFAIPLAIKKLDLSGVVLLFLCLSRGALILLYVDDHLPLVSNLWCCMDNVFAWGIILSYLYARYAFSLYINVYFSVISRFDEVQCSRIARFCLLSCWSESQFLKMCICAFVIVYVFVSRISFWKCGRLPATNQCILSS
jgi:hypothetical protein